MSDPRVPPPGTDGDRAALEAWLTFHRDTLAWKCAGLTPEQVGLRSVPPSTMSLRGLVRHMTEVERHWFARVLSGRPGEWLYWATDEGDFDFGDADDPATAWPADLARWHDEIAASRAVVAGMELDDVGAETDHGWPVTLRWVLLHMIEEYARHNGHADLLRELIDGATGD